MPFLDVCLKKGSDISSGYLTYQPYFKPTSQHLPLATDSGHAITVHSSWPGAEISRLARQSSSEAAFRNACEHLNNRWAGGFLDFDPAIFSSNSFSTLRCRRAKPAREKQQLWLALPYNPIWYRVIGPVVHRLVEKWQGDLAGVFRRAWSMNIAWRNGRRNVLDVLRLL